MSSSQTANFTTMGGFVWGEDIETGKLWFLPDKTANEHREYVNTRVRCPVPGCESTLTTVALSKGRHHLRHLGGGTRDHSPESVSHGKDAPRYTLGCLADTRQ